jgi:acyl carrier protein
MTLPNAVLEFINHRAVEANVAPPNANDDLFRIGVLDSFTLVDLVTLLEEECAIKVADGDVNPANFQSLKAIENYVASRKG